MIPEGLRAEIRRLFFAEHWKVGTIARELRVHHETVRQALRSEGFASRGRVRASALDPYVPLVKETLERYPRLGATRVFEMVRARGYEGSVVQLRRRIRQLDLRPRPAAEAYLRLTTVPGEEAQVDWGHFGRLRVGSAERPLYLFVMVLSWSRAVFVDFSFDQTSAAVLRGHVRAFEDFGGVPRKILYDNMKTVVLERYGDAIRFHPRLLELAGHYRFQPRPCAPYRGNEKGKVERRIRDLRESFMAGRSFASKDELRAAFLIWREEVASRRRSPANPELTVGEALVRERPALLELPANPLPAEDVRATAARKQPYVRYDTNLYSIPHELVGVPLTLAVSDVEVRVFHGSELVARHDRSWDRHVVVEDKAHLEGLADAKRRGRTARGRTLLTDLVPDVTRLYEALVLRSEPLGPNTKALLALLDRHGRDALERAVRAALERGTPRASSVAWLLESEERARRATPSVPLLLPDHPGVRELRTQHHPLEDYDALVTNHESPKKP
jgi:transposase